MHFDKGVHPTSDGIVLTGNSFCSMVTAWMQDTMGRKELIKKDEVEQSGLGAFK